MEVMVVATFTSSQVHKFTSSQVGATHRSDNYRTNANEGGISPRLGKASLAGRWVVGVCVALGVAPSVAAPPAASSWAVPWAVVPWAVAARTPSPPPCTPWSLGVLLTQLCRAVISGVGWLRVPPDSSDESRQRAVRPLGSRMAEARGSRASLSSHPRVE